MKIGKNRRVNIETHKTIRIQKMNERFGGRRQLESK